MATQEIIAIEAQGMGDLFLQLVLIECLVKADKCASVTGIPLGTKCAIPWSIWKESMGSVLFGMLEESGAKIHICGSDSAGPSTSRSVSGLKLLMNKHPSGECVQFDANVFRPGSPTWTVGSLTPHTQVHYTKHIARHNNLLHGLSFSRSRGPESR